MEGWGPSESRSRLYLQSVPSIEARYFDSAGQPSFDGGVFDETGLAGSHTGFDAAVEGKFG